MIASSEDDASGGRFNYAFQRDGVMPTALLPHADRLVTGAVLEPVP